MRPACFEGSCPREGRERMRESRTEGTMPSMRDEGGNSMPYVISSGRGTLGFPAPQLSQHFGGQWQAQRIIILDTTFPVEQTFRLSNVRIFDRAVEGL